MQRVPLIYAVGGALLGGLLVALARTHMQRAPQAVPAQPATAPVQPLESSAKERRPLVGRVWDFIYAEGKTLSLTALVSGIIAVVGHYYTTQIAPLQAPPQLIAQISLEEIGRNNTFISFRRKIVLQNKGTVRVRILSSQNVISGKTLPSRVIDDEKYIKAVLPALNRKFSSRNPRYVDEGDHSVVEVDRPVDEDFWLEVGEEDTFQFPIYVPLSEPFDVLVSSLHLTFSRDETSNYGMNILKFLNFRSEERFATNWLHALYEQGEDGEPTPVLYYKERGEDGFPHAYNPDDRDPRIREVSKQFTNNFAIEYVDVQYEHVLWGRENQ